MAAGLELHAGHGLNYRNVGPIARLDRMAELNIGHSIVSRAVFVGLTQAVREMKDCIDRALLGPRGLTADRLCRLRLARMPHRCRESWPRT